MANNRYTGVTSAAGADNVDARTASTGAQQQTGSTSGVTTTSQNQAQTSGSTTTTNQTTRNLSTELEAQLTNLVRQLAAGGTPQMQQDRQQRIQQISNVLKMQGQYDKASAFGDAQGLIAQQMRRALEATMPGISRAAEDAGSSGGALRALLMQDAADKAAQSSSALGVQTAAQYGGISTNLMQVLETLTRPDATAANALINAVNAGKGAVQQTTGTQTTSGFQNTNTTGTQTSNTNTSANTNSAENKTVDYAPFQANTTPLFFGGEQSVDPSKYVGSTMDTLSQLAGQGNPWASYRI